MTPGVSPLRKDAAFFCRQGAGVPSVCRAQLLTLRPDGEDGEPRWWDVEATPLRGAGTVASLLLQLRDVSVQRRAEAALQDALAARASYSVRMSA